jgi:origin recognition complex subunit 4
MDNHATSAGLKRSFPQSDDASPQSHKKRKPDESTIAPSATQSTLGTAASAPSGVVSHGEQSQKPMVDTIHVNGDGGGQSALSQPAPVPKSRPAIKLAALRGTKWDTGEGPRAKAPKKTNARSTTPRKRAPAAATRPQLPTKNGTEPPPSDNQLSVPPTPNGRQNSIDELTIADVPPGRSPAHQLSPVKPVTASARAIPPPKGILTPTKKRGRPPKSVTFSGKAQKEVFFEDLPKVPSTKKRKTAPKEAKLEGEPGEDEIVCAICSRPDSKAPNQIILCDNCDFAVHQSCYEVSDIPEGEWLCKSCAQEDVLKTPKKPDEIAVPGDIPAVEIPDIPNLDQHLRSLQRVLLDRCSGRRRINIFGQDEAHEKARQVIEQTVVAGEGNSMLLIGSRGCGKTTVSIHAYKPVCLLRG